MTHGRGWWIGAVGVLFATATGCEKSPTPAPARQSTGIRSLDDLHAALKAKNPDYNGQATGKFEKASLVEVSLSGTGVTDLSPLEGQQLEVVELNDTPVSDISPLADMPLEMLYLVNTKVSDLTPLRGSKLEQLWLTNAPVTDLTPLAGLPLVSLTLEGTAIDDLKFVQTLPRLQRLHIAGTKVADLSPLAGMPLTRLIFTPANITRGIEAARELPRCNEIGTSMDARMPPAAFWPEFDAGRIR